jgi:hypothetical protein
MLYDLATAPPEPGSLLESIFMLITTRRREAELFQTEAIIAAVIGASAGDMEAVENALTSYKNVMFPFLEAEKGKRSEMAKKALEQWTSHTESSLYGSPTTRGPGSCARSCIGALRGPRRLRRCGATVSIRGSDEILLLGHPTGM